MKRVQLAEARQAPTSWVGRVWHRVRHQVIRRGARLMGWAALYFPAWMVVRHEVGRYGRYLGASGALATRTHTRDMLAGATLAPIERALAQAEAAPRSRQFAAAALFLLDRDIVFTGYQATSDLLARLAVSAVLVGASRLPRRQRKRLARLTAGTAAALLQAGALGHRGPRFAGGMDRTTTTTAPWAVVETP